MAFGSGNATGLISVQALYVTSPGAGRPETLWAIDTGRPTVRKAQGVPSMPYAQPGGPKLVAISLENDTVYQIFTLPPGVHYPDSYLNDLRFEFTPELSGTSGKGIAYLVDSSHEGFIMLDLGTGESWRRLTRDASTLPGQDALPSFQGRPTYSHTKGGAFGWQGTGLDGMQISSDGARMYYSPLTTDYLYSVPTANLRERDSMNALAEVQARANVSNHGQCGGTANGFEGDSHGLIYQLMPEQNAIFAIDPAEGRTKPFLRDPRLIWPDGASVGTDGYIYVNINQLSYQGDGNDGVDERVYPGAILSAKLPNGGNKITGLFEV